MSEDKQPMSNDNTPITDAVADAQAEGGLVDWQITVSSRDETGYSAKLTAQGECVMVTEYKHLDNGNTLPWQRGSHADAASALRLVADALSRDPTRRALEIAATEISDATGMSPRDEAARLLEQAENAAAGPEELVLTDDKAFDDMLERMRKRCISGR